MILFFFFVPREKRRQTFFVAYSYVPGTHKTLHYSPPFIFWTLTRYMFLQAMMYYMNISVVLLIQQPLWTSPKMLITMKKSQVVLLRSYNKIIMSISLSLSLSLSLFLSVYDIHVYTPVLCQQKNKRIPFEKNKRKNIQHNKNHIISWGMIA